MRFSICIPNYNYERFLGRTIQSVLSQDDPDFEILVSDNASTDHSVDLVREFGSDLITLRVNERNLGFAGNLDRAAGMATGEALIMLSSDDMMRPGALAAYRTLWAAVDPDVQSAVVSSNFDTIDPDDRSTGEAGLDPELWFPDDLSVELTELVGKPVLAVDARELLRRALSVMKNPLSFLSTSYPRRLYEQIGGYGANRLIIPDKWYHWRLLAAASRVYFIGTPLFSYRVHNANQAAQQATTGALKLQVDDYVNTIEISNEILDQVGMKREDIEKAFIERNIGRHGLATLARGEARKARRILAFGYSAYPQHACRNKTMWALRALLVMGPLGKVIARLAYERHPRARSKDSWRFPQAQA